MIEFLFKSLLVVICLVILIPLVMLLVGEGALVGKILEWSLPDNNGKQTEIVADNYGGGTTVSQTVTVNGKTTKKSSDKKKPSFQFRNLTIPTETITNEDGEKGMNFVVSFDTKNMEGSSLYCMICIYDSAGSPIKNTTSLEYRSVKGNLCTGTWCVPQCDKQSSSVTLFLPYSELPQTKGKVEYLADVTFLNFTSETKFDVIHRSEAYPFSYTKN